MSAPADRPVMIVTGATGGIGRRAVSRLVGGGADVVAVDIADGDGRRLPAEVDAERVLSCVADVADEEAVCGVVDAAMARWGRIDGLLNNAGIVGPIQTIVECSSADFDRVMRTNVRGMWLCTKYVLPALRSGGGGAIVNIASGAGLVGAARMSGYTASKHAVVGLTKAMAVECAHEGVRVNAICPGSTDTPLAEALDHAVAPEDPLLARRRREEAVPAGRIGDPDEVARTAAWLLLDAPAHLTGATIAIDGGQTAGSGVPAR